MFWPVYWYFDWRFDILRHWDSFTFIMFRITDDDCACFDDTRFYVLTRVLMVWLLVWHFHSHIGLLTGVLTLTFWHCDFSFDLFRVLTFWLAFWLVLSFWRVLTLQLAFWHFNSHSDVLTRVSTFWLSTFWLLLFWYEIQADSDDGDICKKIS